MKFTNEQLSYLYLVVNQEIGDYRKDIDTANEKRNVLRSLSKIAIINGASTEEEIADMETKSNETIDEMIDACNHKITFLEGMVNMLAPITSMIEDEDKDAYKVGADFFNNTEFYEIQARHANDHTDNEDISD